MWIFFEKKKLTLVSQGVEKENNMKVDKFFGVSNFPGAEGFFSKMKNCLS